MNDITLKKNLIHIIVLSTKPDIIKMSPIYKELQSKKQKVHVIHTGQHFDHNLSGSFIDEFKIIVNKNIGAKGENHEQTAKIIIDFYREIECLKSRNLRPVVYLHGDTLGAFSAGVAAMYSQVECIHIEAGVRTATFNQEIYKTLKLKLNNKYQNIDEIAVWWKELHKDTGNFSYGSLEPYPEQFNARYLDSISKMHFCSTIHEKINIKKELPESENIFVLGNTVTDALENTKSSEASNNQKKHIRFCIHRKENCTNSERFSMIFHTLEKLIKNNHRIFFIQYPATKKAIANFGLNNRLQELKNNPNFICSEVIANYRSAISNIIESYLIITDSGSIQEEANILKIPCITFRYGTDRLFSVQNKGNFILPPINVDFAAAFIENIIKNHLYDEIRTVLNTGTTSKIINTIIHVYQHNTFGFSEEERLFKHIKEIDKKPYRIITDIDGCIVSKHTSSSRSITQNTNQIKKITHFCTGRSAPYVEAISSIIGIDQWCICENGAYLYHPKSDEIILHPLVTDLTLSTLASLKDLLRQQQYKSICKIEPGKEVCISLNSINLSIEELFEIISKEVDTDLLYINHSTTAVDITPKGVDKGSGLKLLADLEQFALADVLAIGDSSGDLPFMTLAGKKACPANATDPVKAICDYISPYPTTEGVIDIINHFNGHHD